MGVWIEIEWQQRRSKSLVVTPLVGVWIEIISPTFGTTQKTVTPLVGVWIEIFTSAQSILCPQSLPLWECGLKYELDSQGIKLE